jgi:hypothetical protein
MSSLNSWSVWLSRVVLGPEPFYIPEGWHFETLWSQAWQKSGPTTGKENSKIIETGVECGKTVRPALWGYLADFARPRDPGQIRKRLALRRSLTPGPTPRELPHVRRTCDTLHNSPTCLNFSSLHSQPFLACGSVNVLLYISIKQALIVAAVVSSVPMEPWGKQICIQCHLVLQGKQSHQLSELLGRAEGFTAESASKPGPEGWLRVCWWAKKGGILGQVRTNHSSWIYPWVDFIGKWKRV